MHEKLLTTRLDLSVKDPFVLADRIEALVTLPEKTTHLKAHREWFETPSAPAPNPNAGPSGLSKDATSSQPATPTAQGVGVLA